MIARVDTERLDAGNLRFLEAFKAVGFEGEAAPDFANRTVFATGDSIYQRPSQAVRYSKRAAVLERIACLTGEGAHRQEVLTLRGGTSTSGQSLTWA
jgi:hypothetical protein